MTKEVLKTIYFPLIKISKILSRSKVNEFLKMEFSKIKSNSCVGTVGSGGEVEEILRLWAKKDDFKVESLDIDPCRNPDILADISDPNIPGDRYDVLVMVEVLEHVKDPHGAVSRIQYLLKSSGKLILTVPFIFPLHDRPNDFFRYTRYGLRLLFKNMRNVNIYERNNWGEAIVVLISRIVMKKTLVTRIFSMFAVISAIIIYPLAYFVGSIIRTDFITTGYLMTANNIEK
jgi:hypothetical protein